MAGSAASRCDWWKREIWFRDLKRKDVVCGIANKKWPFLVFEVILLGLGQNAYFSTLFFDAQVLEII